MKKAGRLRPLSRTRRGRAQRKCQLPRSRPHLCSQAGAASRFRFITGPEVDVFQAAAIQMGAGPVRAENEARALSLLDRACEAGARLVGLPEMWEHVGPAAQKREFAGALEGPQLARVRELCARRSVWCLAGSIAERAADGRVHNTAVLIGPRGEIAASYRKLHLFDVDIPDGARYRESEAVAPGSSAPPVIELTGLGVRLGLSVCYDVRFPELYRRLAEQGADILSVPAAFTAYTGRAHWEVLLRARAVRTRRTCSRRRRRGGSGPPRRIARRMGT